MYISPLVVGNSETMFAPKCRVLRHLGMSEGQKGRGSIVHIIARIIIPGVVARNTLAMTAQRVRASNPPLNGILSGGAAGAFPHRPQELSL